MTQTAVTNNELSELGLSTVVTESDQPTTTITCPAAHRPSRIKLPVRSEKTAGDPVDFAEAEEFLQLFYGENSQIGSVKARLAEVKAEIAMSGTYRHTSEELAFGARVAWRNSARCIGRLYWRSLTIRDLRHVTSSNDIAAECIEHLRLATNGGRIRPVITIFAPDNPQEAGPCIWNEQLIRYAGYADAQGHVLGDPRYTGFTERVTELGWRPPTLRSPFDLLPLVIETPREGVRLFPVPRDVVMEIPLEHPDFSWFTELSLRWHAVPAISNMRLSIGGVSYPAAPFNGWYMGTEIGARNFGDSDRYDVLPEIGKRLNLDMSSEKTLWRDRAMVEVNRAVLHSYESAGVTITDHHTESQRFLTHLAKEEKAGRTCPADWSWIVPPMSGSLTPVFHRYYDTDQLKPEFVLDEEAAHRGQHGKPDRFPTAPAFLEAARRGLVAAFRERLTS